MYKLRDIQVPAVQAGIDFFEREKNTKLHRPSLIVCPTAWGKSILIASIVNQINEKTIVLQPSRELLEQNVEKLKALGGDCSIFSAAMKQKEYGEITYATLGSIKSLGHKFKELGYKHIIVDEADRFKRGKSHRDDTQGMFKKFIEDSGIKSVLGVTATPFKLQVCSNGMENYSVLKMLNIRGKSAAFYKDIIYVSQVQEMVSHEYWSKLLYEVYDVDTGRLMYNSTGADYTDSSLKTFYEDQAIDTRIINRIRESDRKSILVFIPSVDNARDLVSKVPNSAAVWGDMPTDYRKFVISEFRAGRIRVIFNVNVLSVGFDYPEIDMIICGRPTASLGWMYQAYGRGTRIHPNKQDCLIVDFSGNTQKFGHIEDLYYKELFGTWYLFGSGGIQLTGIDLRDIGHETEYSITERELDKIRASEAGNIKFTFGKHKDKLVKDCPHSYLQWIYNEFTAQKSWKSWNMSIKKEIERVLKIKT